jgi:hypothetical protein
MVGLFTLLVLLPCGAWGAGPEPGVHVDPGSPVAKEYVLPLNQARNIGHGPGESASSPRLFGTGIASPRPSRSAATTTKGAGADAGGRRKLAASGSSSSTRRRMTLPDASGLDLAARSDSGHGSLLALLGGGIAVLALGGIGAAAVRRSRRSTPPP